MASSHQFATRHLAEIIYLLLQVPESAAALAAILYRQTTRVSGAFWSAKRVP
jgi:hypothetical protein